MTVVGEPYATSAFLSDTFSIGGGRDSFCRRAAERLAVDHPPGEYWDFSNNNRANLLDGIKP